MNTGGLSLLISLQRDNELAYSLKSLLFATPALFRFMSKFAVCNGFGSHWRDIVFIDLYTAISSILHVDLRIVAKYQSRPKFKAV